MSRLLPIPTDVFRKVDAMLVDVEAVLGRVDTTLASVDTTLSSVDGTLGEVRTLLADLTEQLEVLDQVPALANQLDEVHRVVLALAAAQGIEAAPEGATPTKAKPGTKRAAAKR